MYCRCWLAIALLFATVAATAQPPRAKARERMRQRMEELRERKTLMVDGVERAYTLVQPATREAAIPMVLVFHAASTNPDAMLRMSALVLAMASISVQNVEAMGIIRKPAN